MKKITKILTKPTRKMGGKSASPCDCDFGVQCCQGPKNQGVKSVDKVIRTAKSNIIAGRKIFK